MLPDYQLLEAVKKGTVSEVHSALGRGANVHCRDLNGSSVLEQAERFEQNDIARILIANGADPNQRIGKRGNTLLHRAASSGNIGFAVVLLEHGVDANATNQSGQTPLHLVAGRGYEYLAKYLLQQGATANVTTKHGDTPLHIAARKGDSAMIQLLLNNGADLAIANVAGRNALDEAAAAGNTDASKHLIERSRQTQFDHAETLRRARLVAEKHGHGETALAIQSAELRADSSYVDRISERRAKDEIDKTR
jgi:ankyrin repeat protein